MPKIRPGIGIEVDTVLVDSNRLCNTCFQYTKEIAQHVTIEDEVDVDDCGCCDDCEPQDQTVELEAGFTALFWCPTCGNLEFVDFINKGIYCEGMPFGSLVETPR